MMEDEQGCIVCALRPSHRVSFLFGVGSLSWVCQHTSQQTPLFFVNSWKKISSCVTAALLTSAIAYNIVEIYHNDMKTDRTYLIYTFSETLFMFAGLSTCISAYFQAKQRIKELNGIVSIIEYRQYFGLTILFSKHQQKALQSWLRFILSTMSFLFIGLWLSVVFTDIKAMLTPIMVFKSIVSNLAVLMITLEGINFVTSCWIYMDLFDGLNDHIRKILTLQKKKPTQKVVTITHYGATRMSNIGMDFSHFGKGNDQISYQRKTLKQYISNKVQPVRTKEIFNGYYWNMSEFIPKIFSNQMETVEHTSSNNKFFEKMPLVVRLQRLRRLYSALVWNIKEMNDYYNPTKLIHAILVLFSIVVNMYLVIVGQIEKVTYTLVLAAVIKVAASILGIVYLWRSADYIILKAKGIAAFLYSYPISQLSIDEANEVEMYLDTIHLNTPTLNASGVYTIGTKLLASISGTVVTYVLVALQFKVIWKVTQKTKEAVTDASSK